jgi:hypothetical protein
MAPVDNIAYPDPERIRPLLPHIPPPQRGPVMNKFLDPIRTAGVTSPAAIVKRVLATMKQDLQSRASWRAADELEPLHQAIMAIIAHPSEALALAREAIAYEQLPQVEKEKIKAARGERYRQEYMVTVPPTEKQLAYLRSLGVATAPANWLEASQLVDGRLKGGRHG